MDAPDFPVDAPDFPDFPEFSTDLSNTTIMAFTLQTLNAFEMTHRSATCEIKAARPSHRAFVGVYPPLPEKNLHQWRVKKFEIPSELVKRNPYDGDLVDLQFIRADTLEEVEQILASWGVDSSLFDAPWKSDYPV